MDDMKKIAGGTHDAIHSSRGMQHINRSYQRSFSINIFKINTQELIEITRRVNDPDEGLRFMSQDNREAGTQIHRETTRRIHNFVAASITLVDHTRNFMKENYANTPIFDRYQSKIDTEFLQDPTIKFVQDLRNYMLHNGLPPSEMFLEFKSTPDLGNGAGELNTGIRLKATELASWSRWTAPARTFIEEVGEYIDIRELAETYSRKVLLLQEWLQLELDALHASDLEELRALQASLGLNLETGKNTLLENSSENASDSSITGARKQETSFSVDQAEIVDTAGKQLMSKVKEIELPQQSGDGFKSERPVAANINDEDLLEQPIFWRTDATGKQMLILATAHGKMHGLEDGALGDLQVLIGDLLGFPWIRESLSRSFLQDQIFHWIRTEVVNPSDRGLASALVTAAHETVQPFELWAPIAHLEIQNPIIFGPATIVPLSKAWFDKQEAQALESAPPQRDKISQLFSDLRKEMQGLAAVVVRGIGDSAKVREDGEAVARIVVGLLRFLAPATMNFPAICGNALLGSEIIPTSNLLVIGDGSFSYDQRTLSSNAPGWRIAEQMAQGLETLIHALGTLVLPEHLGRFALAVRSSVLLFSTGATFPNPVERLTYCLSALEAVLLRHSAESVEFNVTERVSLLMAQEKHERERIARNVREAYRLRSRQEISPLAPHEMASVASFVQVSHAVVALALQNVDRFADVSEFATSIDNLRIQRS
jgi:hypothetical protein